MILAIIIVFISLIALMVLHEFGHFILAKIFGVKVEEFGIGYPPRFFGKKIGETLYSLNLLPFGAFVRICGEEKEIKDKRSFSQKSIWQRALIVLGGVLSFWIISAVIFSVAFGIGVPTVISDEELVKDTMSSPEVWVVGVSQRSPADSEGLKAGDKILFLRLKDRNEKLKISKTKEIQEFTNLHKGKEIVLTIQREKKVFDVSLIPRLLPPEGEGPIGISLVRVAVLPYPWYTAPLKGITATVRTTGAIIKGFGMAILNAFSGKPTGVQLMGPVGIGSLIFQYYGLGISYFFQFLAIITIYLAIFNCLPIPAVDGGRLLFLVIEKIKGSPINREIEQKINGIFFTFLILLMIFVTIKDIAKLF